MSALAAARAARSQASANAALIAHTNRAAAGLADALMEGAAAWATDEPMPDLMLLWDTSDEVRTRPRVVSAFTQAHARYRIPQGPPRHVPRAA